MTAFLLTWGPPLAMTYGLRLTDLRAMTLAEIVAYVEFRAEMANRPSS